MRDLLGDEQGEEVAAAPRLGLGAGDEVAPGAARVGEVKALEQRVDVEVTGVDTRLLMDGGAQDDAEGGGEVVVDVLGADRALGEADLEGGAECVVAVALEQFV